MPFHIRMKWSPYTSPILWKTMMIRLWSFIVEAPIFIDSQVLVNRFVDGGWFFSNKRRKLRESIARRSVVSRFCMRHFDCSGPLCARLVPICAKPLPPHAGRVFDRLGDADAGLCGFTCHQLYRA